MQYESNDAVWGFFFFKQLEGYAATQTLSCITKIMMQHGSYDEDYDEFEDYTQHKGYNAAQIYMFNMKTMIHHTDYDTT